MSAHRFTALGAWGSKQTTIAAFRCAKCGFMYVAINFAADRPEKILAIGEDGEDLEASEIADGCPVKG